MVVVFQARAADDAARIDEWWRAHRLDARDLFTDELEAAIAVLVQSPTIGKLVTQSDLDLRDVRRSLMTKTRHFLHYRVVDDTLEILAIWHSARGSAPELG